MKRSNPAALSNTIHYAYFSIFNAGRTGIAQNDAARQSVQQMGYEKTNEKKGEWIHENAPKPPRTPHSMYFVLFKHY